MTNALKKIRGRTDEEKHMERLERLRKEDADKANQKLSQEERFKKFHEDIARQEKEIAEQKQHEENKKLEKMDAYI